ncbi:MAG TPA: class I lanthipeptide [Thermoanaerobaculia bacterium]
MKKNTTPKKLALSRETLRSLADGQLRNAGGGATSLQYSRCESCGIACTVAQLTCTCQ